MRLKWREEEDEAKNKDALVAISKTLMRDTCIHHRTANQDRECLKKKTLPKNNTSNLIHPPVWMQSLNGAANLRGKKVNMRPLGHCIYIWIEAPRYDKSKSKTYHCIPTEGPNGMAHRHTRLCRSGPRHEPWPSCRFIVSSIEQLLRRSRRRTWNEQLWHG